MKPHIYRKNRAWYVTYNTRRYLETPSSLYAGAFAIRFILRLNAQPQFVLAGGELRASSVDSVA